MRRRLEPLRWPAWRYGPNGEAAIFQSEASVPYGWTNKIAEVYVPITPNVPDRESLIVKLYELGIEVSPTWGVAYMKEMLDDRSSAR